MPKGPDYDFTGNNDEHFLYVQRFYNKVWQNIEEKQQALTYVNFLRNLQAKHNFADKSKIPEIARIYNLFNIADSKDKQNLQEQAFIKLQTDLSGSISRNIFRRLWTEIEKVLNDTAEFAATGIGFTLTLGVIMAGVITFILLSSQYHLPALGAYIFLGSVFGTFAADLVAGQVYKCCGFFPGGDDGSGGEDLDSKHQKTTQLN